MKMTLQRAIFTAVLAGAFLIAAGCGGVSVNTYQAAGGAVQIQFHSGGKADFVFAGATQPCTYTEDSKSVTLTCQGQTTVFTINGNQLVPPSDSLIGPLTKK